MYFLGTMSSLFFSKLDGNFQADILTAKEIKTDIHMITREDSQKIARLQSQSK